MHRLPCKCAVCFCSATDLRIDAFCFCRHFSDTSKRDRRVKETNVKQPSCSAYLFSRRRLCPCSSVTTVASASTCSSAEVKESLRHVCYQAASLLRRAWLLLTGYPRATSLTQQKRRPNPGDRMAAAASSSTCLEPLSTCIAISQQSLTQLKDGYVLRPA